MIYPEPENEYLTPPPKTSGPHYAGPGRILIASAEAVSQFQKLLQEFGGPTERSRWQALYARLSVVPQDSEGATVTPRVMHLDKVG